VVVGLDIGTTKVCAVIGEYNEDGKLEITGIGTCPTKGLRKGVVVNIEETLNSVKRAVETAEGMSGRVIFSCCTGIGGNHIESLISRGVTIVSKDNQGSRRGAKRDSREITMDDLHRALKQAEVDLPLDRRVLEVIPQIYKVDGQTAREPLNMIGFRLEAVVNIITCSVTSAQNLIKCVNRAGYKINDLVLKSLAAGRAVLTRDEKDLGVALIDLGGGTTDMLIYVDGAPYATTTLQIGGLQVTNDIAQVQKVSLETAEKIKIENGCCWDDLLDGDEQILVPGMGLRPPTTVPGATILRIIQMRMEEIFQYMKDTMGKKPLGGGVVLTGGGANLPGVEELAADVFGMPVRIGSPLPLLGGLMDECRNPLYATAVGLVLEGDIRKNKKEPERTIVEGPESGGKRTPGGSPLRNFVDWIREEFF
jgi:cell division protein FtsA